MENEELLPKPQTDLPLPEKEIPEHATSASQGDALRSYGRKFPFPKYVFLAIVFVILLVLFAGAYIFVKSSNNNSIPIPPPDEPSYQPSPTPDPAKNWEITDSENNAGWKKYTNINSHMSFSYPETMEAQKRSPGSLTGNDGFEQEITLVKEGPKGVSNYQLIDGLALSFAAAKKDPAINLKDYADKISKPGGPGPLSRTYFKGVTLNDFKGYEVEVSDYSGNHRKIYLEFPNSTSYYYLISIDARGDEKQTYNALADEILSTFKFTE